MTSSGRRWYGAARVVAPRSSRAAAVAVAVGAPDPAQQDAEQLVGVDRLGDVIVHAGFEAQLPIGGHGVGGHGDDRQGFQ